MVARLAAEYPDVRCALVHRSAYELLAATILSAQCTDDRVNLVTPALFARFPEPAALAAAEPAAVEEIIASTGFFRMKAKNLIGMGQGVTERFGGVVPSAIEDLVTLPGVGRKTANVLRSVWFDEPGLPVDTHVTRLSGRLRLTAETDAVKIEHDLGALVDPAEWGRFSLRLIEHGRQVCDARRPRCEGCLLADVCPSVGRAGAVSPPGRGAKRPGRASATRSRGRARS
ncbi:MAG: endonuclease III [Actinomycetota bacterium]